MGNDLNSDSLLKQYHYTLDHLKATQQFEHSLVQQLPTKSKPKITLSDKSLGKLLNHPKSSIPHTLPLKPSKHSFHQKIIKTQQIQFPLSTNKTKIVDSKSRRVKLVGVNWSGAHMCRHCVDGLQYRKLKDICREVREFGFNTVRLTFSLQMFYDNNQISNKYISANPELFNIRALDLFDLTVKELTEAGIMVILNNHISSSMWCCSESDGEGLWWTEEYSEAKWLECLKALTARYKDNQRVIAFDLRNEIRKSPNYSPTWGDDNPKTDWRRASIIGANTVLKQNPNMLVMIGGLNYGLDLKGILKRPITGLIVPNKLVYTGHFYGFSWAIITWKIWSYQAFKKRFWQDQAAVQQLGVPFFIGQFGTNVADTPWKYLMRLMKQADFDFTYWPLDGFKCEPEKDETYGIYSNDFRTVRHPWLLKDLQALQDDE